MWIGELQPSQNPPKPQYRVDKADARHHRQICRANQGFTLYATYPDRKRGYTLFCIQKGGAQHQLQSEEYRKDDRLEDTADHLRGTPHVGKRSLAHEHTGSHHQRGHGTQFLQDNTNLSGVNRHSNHQ